MVPIITGAAQIFGRFDFIPIDLVSSGLRDVGDGTFGSGGAVRSFATARPVGLELAGKKIKDVVFFEIRQGA